MSNQEGNLAVKTLHNFLTVYHHFRTTNRQISEHGIQPRSFSVLRFLYERGAVTVGAVQEYIYRSPSTASTLIARLEEEGYVTRTRSSEDNRVVIVELTDAGRRVAVETPMQGIPLLRRKLETLSEEQLLRINAGLDDILTLMEVEMADDARAEVTGGKQDK